MVAVSFLSIHKSPSKQAQQLDGGQGQKATVSVHKKANGRSGVAEKSENRETKK